MFGLCKLSSSCWIYYPIQSLSITIHNELVKYLAGYNFCESKTSACNIRRSITDENWSNVSKKQKAKNTISISSCLTSGKQIKIWHEMQALQKCWKAAICYSSAVILFFNQLEETVCVKFLCPWSIRLNNGLYCNSKRETLMNRFGRTLR